MARSVQQLDKDQAERTASAPTRKDSVSKFINRDLSLVEFFRRVLEEAEDATLPVLERVKFISILSANLDEFFMIRVAGIMDKLGREEDASADGQKTAELLTEITTKVREITNRQSTEFTEKIRPALTDAGISLLSYGDLEPSERTRLDQYFDTQVYPLITPQAVDPTHPFPYITGGSLNIGLRVLPTIPRRVQQYLDHFDGDFFIRIKIPPFVPRLIPVDDSEKRFIFAEDLIIANISKLVPEAAPADCHLFRITRDADVDLREAETEDLLQTMEQNLKARRFGDVVRLEISRSIPADMKEYLLASLNISKQEIFTVEGQLNLADMMRLCSLDRPDLKNSPIEPVIPNVLSGSSSIFDVIRAGDVLLHHPYMPYSIVVDMLREAVDDPDVLAIKMCLYRIGSESPVAPLLIEASEKGKQVTALIEIKARFDEANNIEWAKRLESAGVHVVYGLLGLKTHSKTTLIIRRENDELVRYVHLATGNYNPETSAFYTDLGLLTADDAIGADATELFNYLSAYSRRERYGKLVVAPIYMRERMLELIKRETDHAENGRPSGIVAKMNRLADHEIISALYDASNAGVPIDLIVRGVCSLRPGVPGLSENIRVRSIVGPLLEHSRVYGFKNGGDAEVFTGSADWMPRNLDRRVEVLAPVTDPAIKRYLLDELLSSYLKDNVKARELGPDGLYQPVDRSSPGDFHDSQLSFVGVSEIS